MEKPTLYPEGEGRWKDAGITEVASIDSRGSRGGMLWRKYRAARETRYGGGETTAQKKGPGSINDPTFHSTRTGAIKPRLKEMGQTTISWPNNRFDEGQFPDRHSVI